MSLKNCIVSVPSGEGEKSSTRQIERVRASDHNAELYRDPAVVDARGERKDSSES